MSDTYKPGTWRGGQFRRDTSGRFPHQNGDEQSASVPYPEATYWGARTGNKVFDPTPGVTGCVLVDALGNMILTAGGDAIACP